MKEQIFVSYRRDGGDVTAKLICEALKNKGYTVFYDYDSISGGFFDERIFDSISTCNDFILILSKNSLDRCVNEDDWVRQEIACALKHKKHIIPVMLEEFKFPANLPSDIEDVARINAVQFFMSYFEAFIDAIRDRLISKPIHNIIPDNFEERISQNLKFTFREDLKGYGVAIGKCTDTEIRIPDTYEGKVVVAIEEAGFKECSGLKAIILPKMLKNIGKHAFHGCVSLETITLPDTVTDIDGWAFYNCSALKHFVIPQNVKNIGTRAFTDCTSLLRFEVDKGNRYYCDYDENLYTKNMSALVAYACGQKKQSYTVPEGVTKIEDSAFSYASSLSTVSLPNSVTHIEKFAFIDCANLESITLPKHATNIDNFVFKRCSSLVSVTLPEGIQTIGEDLFRGCSSLKTVILPKTLKIIDGNAFFECTSLENITIPSNVTDIGKWAFYNCSALRSVVIPKHVKNIGARAFANCTSLLRFEVDPDSNYYCNHDDNLYTKDMSALVAYACGKKEQSYTVPEGVTKIEDSAFSNASSLSTVSLPNSVTHIEKFAFVDCANLESITLPKHATNIDNFVFKRCSSLVSVTLPEGIQTIGEDLFRGCSSLKTVILPKTLKIIDKNAFYECTSLESITIPNNVTDIGKWAFFGCSSLKSIVISKHVKNIGARAFASCPSLEKIDISMFHRAYCYKKGALLTKNKKTLFAYASGLKETSYTIPHGVTHIEDSAFSHSKLEDITIPATVTEIGEYSFNNCKKLKTIRFEGTAEAFKNVNVKGTSFNQAKTKQILCADGITVNV